MILPLYDIMMPPNINIFFTELMKVCAFDPIPTNDLWHNVFQLEETGALSPNFDTIGYESYWVIVNLGSFTFIVVAFPVLLIVRPILKPCRGYHRVKKTRKWLR